MKDFSKAWMVLVFALILPLSSQAQTELPQAQGFVGLDVGYADPTNLDGRFGIGADVGLMFPSNWTALGFFRSSTAETDGVENSFMHYGLGSDYIIGLPAGRLSLGGRIGAETRAVSGGAEDEDSTELAIGPHIGYDYPVNETFSVGADSSLMVSFGDASVSTLYVLGSVKYWF